jgi:hypothetical protein
VLLIDGRIDGLWSYEIRGRRLNVRIEPFVDMPERARRAAQEEAERLAAFLGGTLEQTLVALIDQCLFLPHARRRGRVP